MAGVSLEELVAAAALAELVAAALAAVELAAAGLPAAAAVAVLLLASRPQRECSLGGPSTSHHSTTISWSIL